MRKQLYLATTLAIFLAFVLGLLIGATTTTTSLDSVTQTIRHSELATQSYLLEQELLEGFDDAGCSLAQARLQTLSEDLYRLGKLLDTPTAQQDLGLKQYDLLKRKFHLLQIQTYILHLRLKKNCNLEPHIILYYYSRQDTQSVQQGKILDDIVKNFNVRVFAIEHNYSQELSFLEEYYSITNAPSLVIDYNTTHHQLVDYTTLASELQ